MRKSAPLFCALLLSLSVRRAWIEILDIDYYKTREQSLSVRRAWIEIKVYGSGDNKKIVALRKESVDRNKCIILQRIHIVNVALRKESVDRNVKSL